MIKVDIISGFLGAGKTTLIQKLLKEIYAGQNVVLIENEFGEIGIDGGFLKEAGIEIREMNSGCICCSLVGDFSESLKEVVKTYNPERIIIEPSGVGKLSDVTKAIEGVKAELDLEIAYKAVVIDVSKCKMYMKNFGEFYLNQIENADTIFFSRTDIAKSDKVEDAIAMIKEHNPNASLVTTPVEQLQKEVVLSALDNKNTAKQMLEDEHHHHHHEDGECCCGHDHEHHHHHEDEECCCGHDHEHHHNHEHHHHDGEECSCGHDHHDHEHHHAEDVFTSWGTETSVAFSKNKLEEIFAKFERETKGAILRSKGIVKSEEGEEWIYFDYVPGQFDIRFGTPDYIGKVCVIASGYTEEELQSIFLG